MPSRAATADGACTRSADRARSGRDVVGLGHRVVVEHEARDLVLVLVRHQLVQVAGDGDGQLPTNPGATARSASATPCDELAERRRRTARPGTRRDRRRGNVHRWLGRVARHRPAPSARAAPVDRLGIGDRPVGRAGTRRGSSRPRRRSARSPARCARRRSAGSRPAAPSRRRSMFAVVRVAERVLGDLRTRPPSAARRSRVTLASRRVEVAERRHRHAGVRDHLAGRRRRARARPPRCASGSDGGAPGPTPRRAVEREQHVGLALAEPVRLGVGCEREAQVAHDRPGLLREPDLVEPAHVIAVEHRRGAEHLRRPSPRPCRRSRPSGSRSRRRARSRHRRRKVARAARRARRRSAAHAAASARRRDAWRPPARPSSVVDRS